MVRRRRNPPAVREALGAALALGLLGVAAYYGAPEVIEPIVSRIKYGSKLGPDADARTGFVNVLPATLAKQLGVQLEVYSLARMIRSEAGSAGAAERRAVAWVARNNARSRGISLTQLLTAGGGVAAGYYGKQNLGGRYAATGQAARQGDVDLALQVLGGTLSDNTDGALHFFNPALQDKLFASNAKKYTKNADAVIASWTAKGLEARTVAGTNPATFLVFVQGKALTS
jgi:hypothetical protein